MAHYAFLTEPDENGVSTVTEVIVGRDEGDLGIDWEEYYGQRHGLLCRRTSYNTLAGGHTKGGTPYRQTYAGIGYRFDPSVGPDGAFLPPES
jgi:hypothetical protein